jgi:cell fate (sporulation/competence/biofilm development) regulator YlbF (YheA/YmcA/DUF963 family)
VINEKAQELGRLLGQGDEYQALQKARELLANKKELENSIKALEELAARLEQALVEGKKPETADEEKYERLLSEVQGDTAYQQLVAAQSNFDKLMLRVQEQIMEGMRKGADSRIITLG